MYIWKQHENAKLFTFTMLPGRYRSDGYNLLADDQPDICQKNNNILFLKDEAYNLNLWNHTYRSLCVHRAF